MISKWKRGSSLSLVLTSYLYLVFEKYVTGR